MHEGKHHRDFLRNRLIRLLFYVVLGGTTSLSLLACNPIARQTKVKPKIRTTPKSIRLVAPRYRSRKLPTIKVPKRKPKPSQLYALLIGTQQYPSQMVYSRSCCVSNDLEGIEQVLLRDLGAKRDNILKLPNSQVPATVSGIRQAILMHLYKATERDRVLVWYTGQGIPATRNKKLHLLLGTADLSGNRLRQFRDGSIHQDKVLSAKEMSLALKGLNTKKSMIFLDIRGRGRGSVRSFMASKIASVFRKDGHFVVSSSHATRRFQAIPKFIPGIRGNKKGYGALAYTLMESLSGHARDTTGPKRQPDSWVDHREVLTYIQSRYKQLGSLYGFGTHTLVSHDPLPKSVRLRKFVERNQKEGLLFVSSTPSNATVWIDGHPEGKTPLRIYLAPGDHRIEIRKDGYTQYFRRFRIMSRQKHTVVGTMSKHQSKQLRYLSQMFLHRRHRGDLMVPDQRNYLLKDPSAPDEDGQSGQISKKSKHPPGTLRSIRSLQGTKRAYIPPGSFYMGSTHQEHGRFKDEDPRRRVTLNHGFWMMQTEVTQGQFKKLRGYNPSQFKSCGTSCPVEKVTWHEALAFANKLSKLQGLPTCFVCRGSGKKVKCKLKQKFRKDNGRAYLQCRGWRLPVEAEWEFAARAGSHRSRYGQIQSIAWYSKNTGPSPMPVKMKLANPWNLHDMLGNVYELCWDWYRGSYRGASQSNPVGPSRGKYKVIRGGSWVNEAENVRNADRFLVRPKQRLHYLGFRLVRSDP